MPQIGLFYSSFQRTWRCLQISPTFQKFINITSLLWKTHISICFRWPKEIWTGFSLSQKKIKSKGRVSTWFARSPCEGSVLPQQPPRHHPLLPRSCTQLLSIEMLGLEFVSGSMCALSLLCASIRRVLRYPESLREVLFGVWERLNMFPQELTIMVSSPEAVSAWWEFPRNTPFSDSRESWVRLHLYN